MSGNGSCEVGVDCEWRPSFAGATGVRLSLMQIATRDACFLLDILTLAPQVPPNDWTRFVQYFFNDASIVKLGYGIVTDLKMFSQAFPHVASLMRGMQGVLDLLNVHQHLKTNFPQVFQCNSDVQDADVTSHASSDVIKSEERGLSELVRLCFGKALSKAEQLSDWERRPLRATQMRYAALDAMCLIDVYAHLQERIALLELDVDLKKRFLSDTSTHAFAAKSKAEKRRARVREREESDVTKRLDAGQTSSPSFDRPAIPVQSFKVVVDNSLQGLGKWLRY